MPSYFRPHHTAPRSHADYLSFACARASRFSDRNPTLTHPLNPFSSSCPHNARAPRSPQRAAGAEKTASIASSSEPGPRTFSHRPSAGILPPLQEIPTPGVLSVDCYLGARRADDPQQIQPGLQRGSRQIHLICPATRHMFWESHISPTCSLNNICLQSDISCGMPHGDTPT